MLLYNIEHSGVVLALGLTTLSAVCYCGITEGYKVYYSTLWIMFTMFNLWMNNTYGFLTIYS